MIIKNIALLFLCFTSNHVLADTSPLEGVFGTLSDQYSNDQMAGAVKVLILLTVLSLAPSILIVMTSFIRIILVLSMLRHALGMPQTPPNTILISLALFLTLFSMSPVLKEVNDIAYQPFSNNEIGFEEALDQGVQPIKLFMLKHTRENDLFLMMDLSKEPPPDNVEDLSLVTLIPAFMISELITAFKIGFIIFLPFLLVDIIVASLLMSMGMLMVPPMMMSLPIKILLFVLIDGWNLVVEALMGSF